VVVVGEGDGGATKGELSIATITTARKEFIFFFVFIFLLSYDALLMGVARL
jgi:hypothetical protein